MIDEIKFYQLYFENQSPDKLLKYFLEKYQNEITFASSLGAEDQVLTDMILKINPEARIFTLDTGRLFQETYDLMDETMKKYHFHYEIYFPDYHHLEKMISDKGANLFYESIENRKLCCSLRKIDPLKRALTGVKAWITGIRRSQSSTRNDMKIVEKDDQYPIVKVNPLINWEEHNVFEYLKKHHVPYNKLHDIGYRSIGCVPCTRAVNEGEDLRSGRWWWENESHRECGLHSRKSKIKTGI